MRKLYLDLDVSHFGSGADDRSPHQSWKNVLREIRAGISALHKLKDRQTGSYTITNVTNLKEKRGGNY